MIDDDTADRLAGIASHLATRVRDYPADDNAEWLARQLPDPGDWFRLSFMLAVAVPDDCTWRDLTRWTQAAQPLPPPRREPACGTPSGYRRHAKKQEKACGPCKAAEAERGRRRRLTAAPVLQAA